jgi:small conductance mechanosensitive channel
MNPDTMSLDATKLENLINNYLVPWGTRIFFALVILVLGLWIARRLSRVVGRLLQRADVHGLLGDFLSKVVYWLGMVVVLFAVLDQLGVTMTSALAVLGAAGLAVGLALKDSLSNVAAGVMIIFFRLFDSGDFVEAGGVSGKVMEVNLFHTRLLTPDNREIVVPNSQIYSAPVTNYSANDTRRIDMVFGIAYEDDIGMAKKIISEILTADDRLLRDPVPVVAVSELADNSVNLVARPWVRAKDYWDARFDLIEQIKLAFDREGISIPYPQRDVHLHRVGAA